MKFSDTACAAIAASALLALPVQARAAETTEVPITINYAASQAARAPSVLIPKEIRLKDETTCDYSVWAYCEKAELGSLFDHVTVEPSDSFVLTNERTGDTFTASVEQDVTEFLADDVKNGEEYDMDGTAVMRRAAEGTISVEGIPEGRWTGAMTFYVNEVAHDHRWIVPVMSEDGIYLQGYACPCGETSHAHSWDIVHKVESGFSAGAVSYWECSECGGTINPGDYAELSKANEDVSKKIMDAWIAANIKDSMTDSEKAKAILREVQSWSYGAMESYAQPNVMRRALCKSGNSMFVIYCNAAGLRAEIVDVSYELGTEEHWMVYVWLDGEKCITDATPGGHGVMGTQPDIWTEDGFWLYLDWLDGYVTDEEFEDWIAAEER